MSKLKLDERFNKIKKKKSASVTVTEAKSNMISLENHFNFEICRDNKDLNIYLNKKGSELISDEINSNLEAGKILTEVFERLSGVNQYDGLYNKWLEVMEYNARTAHRHRIRYSLFKAATTEIGKKLFATLPVRALDKLNVHAEKVHFIELVNNSDIKTKEELISFMESDNVKEVGEKYKPITPFYKPIFSYRKKVEKLEASEAYKALKELEEAEKEIKKIKKIIKEKTETLEIV